MRNINKTRWTVLALLILLLLGGLVLGPGIHDYYVKSKLDPQAELQASLKNMAKVNSYKYSLKSMLNVNSRKEVISEVKGEKNHGNTHIKGEMVNTSIDIYFIDHTIYNYDAFSEKWLVIDSNSNNSEELLISELNPLSNFRFKQLNLVEKKGFEKIDGVECMLVACQPSVDSELLESLWKNIEYQIWLDYKKDLIRKASLKAINKKAPSTSLNIEVEFYDLNKNIKIERPDVNNHKN